ncbi:MAG: hypothetical protein L6Q34_13835, partial [Nitrospira sp.]|nr:hypothetical protein [Nitrospira sp.]
EHALIVRLDCGEDGKFDDGVHCGTWRSRLEQGDAERKGAGMAKASTVPGCSVSGSHGASLTNDLVE